MTTAGRVGKINKWNHYSVPFLKKEPRCSGERGKKKECRVKICVSGSLSRFNDGHWLADSSASRRDVISGSDGVRLRHQSEVLRRRYSPRQFHHRHMSNELFIFWNRFNFFSSSSDESTKIVWFIIDLYTPNTETLASLLLGAHAFFVSVSALGCLATTRVCVLLSIHPWVLFPGGSLIDRLARIYGLFSLSLSLCRLAIFSSFSCPSPSFLRAGRRRRRHAASPPCSRLFVHQLFIRLSLSLSLFSLLALTAAKSTRPSDGEIGAESDAKWTENRDRFRAIWRRNKPFPERRRYTRTHTHTRGVGWRFRTNSDGDRSFRYLTKLYLFINICTHTLDTTNKR